MVRPTKSPCFRSKIIFQTVPRFPPILKRSYNPASFHKPLFIRIPIRNNQYFILISGGRVIACLQISCCLEDCSSIPWYSLSVGWTGLSLCHLGSFSIDDCWWGRLVDDWLVDAAQIYTKNMSLEVQCIEDEDARSTYGFWIIIRYVFWCMKKMTLSVGLPFSRFNVRWSLTNGGSENCSDVCMF